MEYTYDVAVVGGGPAGYIAAIRAAQLGGRVVLFERDRVGGTCLNRGCIPTKSYLRTAELLREFDRAQARGIRVNGSVETDFARVRACKEEAVRRLTGGVAGLLRSHGVEVVPDTGRLVEERTVEAGGRRYTAASVILAGGSRAAMPPVPGLEGPDFWTSDELLDAAAPPASLIIVGGGVVGCEFATAFAAFGSRITVVEAREQILPGFDEEAAAAVAASLREMGVEIHTARKVERAEPGAALVLGDGTRLEAEKVLVSTGRAPVLDCLGELLGKIRTERGAVVVDSHMRTNSPHVYAAGDITGKSMLAHAAFHMGETAAVNAMGGDSTANLSAVPSCLYTAPEAAMVGMTEAEARRRGEPRVGRFPFAANGRAVASGEAEGFVKVIAHRETGELLGVHMVGASATECIAEAASMMAMEITAHEAAEIIHPHPTYSEAFMEACADALGRCLHLPRK